MVTGAFCHQQDGMSTPWTCITMQVTNCVRHYAGPSCGHRFLLRGVACSGLAGLQSHVERELHTEGPPPNYNTGTPGMAICCTCQRKNEAGYGGTPAASSTYRHGMRYGGMQPGVLRVGPYCWAVAHQMHGLCMPTYADLRHSHHLTLCRVPDCRAWERDFHTQGQFCVQHPKRYTSAYACATYTQTPYACTRVRQAQPTAHNWGRTWSVLAHVTPQVLAAEHSGSTSSSPWAFPSLSMGH